MKSEQDGAPAPVPKTRFKPKIPQKKPKSAAPKVEQSDTKGDVIDKEILAKLNAAKSEDGFGRRAKKVERESARVQVAFGHGSSSLIRSFGNPKGPLKRSSTVTGEVNEDGFDFSARSFPTEKEYVEPWDYSRTYYPITLPLRLPNLGDPEILNKEEFGEDSARGNNMPVDPPAQELGLMEASRGPEMFLFQFPAALPLAKKRSATANGESTSASAETANVGDRPRASPVKEGCTLKDLPSGFVGKMLVYKSGKVKMKMGDALFDVSPGQNCAFAQEAAVINVKEKHCCVIGDLRKRVVVTPDVDSLLDSIDKM